MGKLYQVLAYLLNSGEFDKTSPIPGLFSLTGVIDSLKLAGYPGKGEGGSLSKPQIRAVKIWLEKNFDRVPIKGNIYYRPRVKTKD